MDVSEIRLSRKTDLAEFIATFDSLALGHGNASRFHVAVLCFPAAAMIDNDAVAAFPAFDVIELFVIAQQHVGNAVAGAFDHAIG